MIRDNLLGYKLLGSLLAYCLLFTSSGVAQDRPGCAERATKLNDYFGAQYIELDAQCYGSNPTNEKSDSDVTQNQSSPDTSDSDRSGDSSGDSTHTDSPPTDAIGSAPSEEGSGTTVGTCGPPELSDECKAKYEALAAEATRSWEALYAECPVLTNPVQPDLTGESAPRQDKSSSSANAPSFRAPTKKELLKKVKNLERKLRRAKSSQRKLSRRCRR